MEEIFKSDSMSKVSFIKLNTIIHETIGTESFMKP